MKRVRYVNGALDALDTALRPAFVVITGDLVNKPGDAGQIAEFQRIAAKVDDGA